jgi:predicted DNA binding CopG/RHH family protein
MSMPKKKPQKPIPQFENEAQEQAFWSAHDSTEYVDWSKAQRVTLGRLKPSTQTISIRLPAMLLEDLKRLANKRDVPYQSLVKIFLAERVAQEQRSHS